MRQGLVALLFGLGLMLCAQRVEAQDSPEDEEARVHFRLGRAYYDSGRFEDAAREFQQAYQLSNRPQLLYNLFVAQRDAGNIADATVTLRTYLELVPDAPDRDQLRARLASMERLQAQQNGNTNTNTNTNTTPPPDNTATPPPDNTATPPPDETTTNVSDDSQPTEPRETAEPVDEGGDGGGGSIVPFIVMGGGGALIVTSLVVGMLASGKESDLEELCPNDRCPPDSDYESMADSGRSLATVSDILLVSGVVVAGTGVALMFLMGGDEEEESANVSAACTTTGCMGSVSGRF